jgi:transposase
VARELTLSFVPDAEQRLWRTVTRRKYQLTRDRVRLQNQLEALKLRATPEQLCDALGACADLKPVYRRLLKMALEQLQFLEQQISQLDQELASLLRQHQDAVQRLAEVPALGVDSAQQIIAEVGPTAASFPSAKQLSSWVGACPGDDESAGVNYSHRSPNQAANAAAKAKGSIFDIVYRRSVPRLGHNQAIGALAHRQCQLVWLILHQGVRYQERGPAVTQQSKRKRTWRMIRQLRSLGYRIEQPSVQSSQAHAQ